MRRILAWVGLAAALAISPSLFAQNRNPHSLNHVELGAYGDLFRVSPANSSSINFLGFGGRLGINVHPHVALEGEINYDFEQNYTAVTTNGGTITSTTVNSSVRPLSGLFGPKFQLGTSGPVRAFITGKAGFIEFSNSSATASGRSFVDSFSQFGNASTHFAVYPGGGLEFFAGPLGLRIEAGDLLYVNNGTYNNLRVSFGPTLRF